MSGKKAVIALSLASCLCLGAFAQASPESLCLGLPLPRLAAADQGGGQADAVSGATAEAKAPERPFLGFKDKVSFHKFAGWSSGGLLLAAGVVGAVRILGLMDSGHAYRDANGIDEDSISPLCAAEIAGLWSEPGGQSLRWVHVGLLAAGESLYLADAVTGIGFMAPLKPGLSRSRLHRYAFFAHAALMASEAVTGLLLSDALSRGDHEAVRALGYAHAGLGIAVPLLILGSGAAMELLP